MRHIIILIALLLAGMVFAGEITLVESQRNGVALNWKLDSYEIRTVGDYTVVSFPGGDGLYAVGRPNIPSQQVFIEIPMGATPVLHVSDPVFSVEKAEAPIVPAQEPPIDTIGEERLLSRFCRDDAAYESSEPFPGNVVEIAYQGVMRGRNLILVRFNPIQYVPATGEVRVYTSFGVRIEFGGDSVALAQTDDAMDPIASAMVLNYVPGQRTRESAVDFLIVTVTPLAKQANDYAAFKESQGFHPQVEVLTPNPSVAAVKEAIQRYYPAAKYVMIIGDHPLIKLPSSGTDRHPLGTDRCRLLGLEDGSIPSDNYYACIEGTDYYPDVYMGRVPAGNPQEAEFLLNRLKNYQANPPAGDWRKRFLLCGEYQYQYSNRSVAERLFCETAFTIWYSLKDKYVFPTKTIGTGSSVGPRPYYFRKSATTDPTKPGTYRDKIRDAAEPVVECRMPDYWADNVVDDATARTNTMKFWNEGCFLVQHRDHGGNTSWGKPGLGVADMKSLTNGDKLPVLFSVNCLTGSMDYSTDCFVEAALKNPNGGAVAAIGSTRVSYSWWNDRLCDGFYTCMFGTDGFDCFDVDIDMNVGHPFSRKLGVVLNFGRMYLARNYPQNPWGTSSDYTETEFYLFHCIGDPAMEILLQ